MKHIAKLIITDQKYCDIKGYKLIYSSTNKGMENCIDRYLHL